MLRRRRRREPPAGGNEKEAFVTQRVRAVLIGMVCFVLGAVVQRLYDGSRTAAPAPAPTQAAAPKPDTDIRIAEEKGAVAVVTPQFEHEPLWAYGFDKPPAP